MHNNAGDALSESGFFFSPNVTTRNLIISGERIMAANNTQLAARNISSLILDANHALLAATSMWPLIHNNINISVEFHVAANMW
jgi:hypothetical protein